MMAIAGKAPEIINVKGCRNCKYMHLQGRMYCRFNPPTQHLAPWVEEKGSPKPGGSVSSWPSVDPDWWCGQYKPKLELLNGDKP